MVNFVYLVGDRETGEAVAIDPAYDIRGLLDILAADDMRLVGALATHYHPDHVGGEMMGYTISGVRELLTINPVPIHVQADEAPWVMRVTGASTSDLVEHTSGDTVTVGDIPIELIHTPGAHAGQSMLPRRRPARRGRHVVPRRVRSHRPAGWRSARALREHHAEAGEGPRRRHPVPRTPLFHGAVRIDGRDAAHELRVPSEDRGAVAHDVRQLSVSLLGCWSYHEVASLRLVECSFAAACRRRVSRWTGWARSSASRPAACWSSATT